MKYVIIGNGAAAAGTINGIRRGDPYGPITVISQEKHPVYARPLISYLLEGKTTVEKMEDFRGKDFYKTHGCEVLFGQKAVQLDPARKSVLLDGGAKIEYDKVCVATGSSPFIPPFEGLDTIALRHTFQTLDDALALEQAIGPDSRVFIVGAGLIGMKCAEGLAKRVKSVTVTDLAPKVLSSILDDECAAILQKKLEENGIRLLLGDSVERFTPGRRAGSGHAHLKSGADVDFDALVLALGVRANITLVKDAGGQVERGIVVDDHMRTSLPDVYAAGDCACGMDVSFGKRRVLAVLPNAVLQGECAGENMAGCASAFSNAIPLNAIGFFGLHLVSAGTQTGEVYEEREADSLKKLFYADDRLKGFLLLGNVDKAGIYTSLIRNQTPLHDIDFELVKKRPTLLAFQQSDRQKKLGGVV